MKYLIIDNRVYQKFMQLSEKPKSLFCYICGREFGTTSLSIHLKSCMKKFEIEQSKKQSKDKIKLPNAPQQLQSILGGNLDGSLIQSYNQKAINTHKYQVLPKCKYCSRTFNEQSLKAHQNGCNKKGTQKPDDKSSNSYSFPDAFKKPRTLTCCICGRDFGLTSLKIHYPQCSQKFRDDQNKKPKNERKEPPQFSQQQLQMINNKQDWTLQEIQNFNKRANNNYRDNAMVQCPNCGRKFIQQSYQKHKKNCTLINGNKNPQPQTKARDSSSKQANFRPTSPQFKKPRTLTCCVCGRQFGLTSLKIHYPQCLQKFKNQQSKKEKADRRTPPQFSEEQLQMINNKETWTLQEIDEFNNKANGNYRDKGMVQCPNCGRKFLEQSYQKHKKNCTLINGDKNRSTDGKQKTSSSVQNNFRPSSPQFKKPRTLTCCVCGRDFGLTSLKIHYPQCLQKFKNDEKKKPKSQRKQPPQFTQEQLEMINNKQNWTIQQIDAFNNKANVNYRDNAMVQCPNCGRKFLEQSYLKHKKNCALINGQNKSVDPQKPKNQKLTQNQTQLKKPKVLMCHICGREFGLASLNIHKPQCEQKFLNQQKKKQKQQRRPLPVIPEQQLKRFDISNAISWQAQKIQQYNKIANEVYRAQSLCPCPICGRKFFQQSLPKHLKFCQKNKQKQASNQQKQKMSNSTQKRNSPANNRKSGNLSKKPIAVNQIKQQQNQQSFKNSPNEKKEKQQNESFLRKSLYRKLQNSDINKDCPDNIPQVEQSLQQTFKSIKNQIKGVKQIQSGDQNQFITSENVQKIQESTQILQPQKDKIIVQQKKIKQQILKQDKKQSSKQIKAKKSELNKSSIINKSQLNKSIDSRPQSRGKDIKNKSIQMEKQAKSNLDKSTLDKSQLQNKNQQKKQKKNEQSTSLQKKTKKLDENSGKEKQKVKQLDIEEIQSSKQALTNQVPRSVLSPADKIREGKGFAAPRKKEQNIQASMKQCKICNRKFDEDRIQKHEKICLQNKQRQRKSQRSIQSIQNDSEQSPNAVQKIQQRLQQKKQQMIQRKLLTPQEKVRQKKGFAAPRQKQAEIQAHMSECRGCKRRFNSDRIQKHQAVCKQAQQQLKQPFVVGSYKKIEQNAQQEQKVSIKRVPCPKCNRKFAQQRLQKHLQVCKVNPPVSNKQQSGVNNKKNQKVNKTTDKIQGNYKIDQQKIQAQRQAAQNMNLQLCEKCGRKFLAERIQKHQQICKGTNNQPKKQKQPLPPPKQYNLQKLQVKQDNQIDQRVQCPRCFRKFASDRLDKHLNACKAVPPLNNNDSKNKIHKKQQTNAPKQVPNSKSSMQSPKNQQKIISTAGDDQYVQTQLVQCEKCSRKFVPQRLQKHTQICKGTNKIGQKHNKNTLQTNNKKLNDQQIRKTKNQFFNMVKDLKTKLVKQEELQKQLDNQLMEIQGTNRVTKKQNINRTNSQKKKGKDAANKSLNLPKI